MKKSILSQIDEGSIFELNPASIKVNEELPRHRKELGKIQDMVTSIKAFGQFQPIVINRNNELIVGGRRLAACLLGGFQVRACYKDTIDPLLMREMELEENIQRKSLTPAEESTAVADLVAIKQEKYGKPVQGQTGGFTLNDAAAIIGKTKGSVIESLQLAEAVRMFPNLAECKTKSDIKKAVKSLERTQRNVVALKAYNETIRKSDEAILVNRTAEEYMQNLPSESIDLFFTDPPYGIDIHNIAMTVGGETGGKITTTGTKYDDSEVEAKNLLLFLTKESFRVTKDTGHAYIFCAPSHFWWLQEQMQEAGWLVAPRPVVWIKRESGQNNQPDYWFSSAYEFILFARKPNSRIIIPGKPDWIQCDPVLTSERVHQAEKPVVLCKELISRVCLPGGYILDCCMGSGAIIEAALDMKCLALGCEKDTEIYASAVARITKLKEKNK